MRLWLAPESGEIEAEGAADALDAIEAVEVANGTTVTLGPHAARPTVAAIASTRMARTAGLPGRTGFRELRGLPEPPTNGNEAFTRR